MEDTQADPGGGRWRRLKPRYWGIAARSAAGSAAVVVIALAAATAGLLALLQGLLLSSVDDAATARVTDIVAGLRDDPPQDIDDSLLATDQRVAAVQILAADGTVVRHSPGAPTAPLLPAGTVGSDLTTGLGADRLHGNDLRISAKTTTAPIGVFTVVVAGDSGPVKGTVRTVAILLIAMAPLVIAEAAAASYYLVWRSLRSVDAIRSRVAAISASDLSGRVPVPPSHDEVAALAITMNEMLERIETGHRSQRQFVGDASHELRAPLTSMLSALEVVESHPELLTAELVSTTLLPEAYRMSTLIEDLLLLARADERGLALQHEDVDLDEVVVVEVDRSRPLHALSISAHLDAARLRGDRAALARMFRNLLDNAVRHAASRLEITLRNDHDDIVLIVADDGPGIPVPERERIFDRFVRLDADRSRLSGGTGLGLAIVAETVDAHGGTVVIDDRPRGGARVTVRLPSRQ